jgi:hypothetical protein
MGQCADLRETAEVIAKVGFKMFLGVAANVGGWAQEDSEFSLYLDDNPLVDFVELPEHLRCGRAQRESAGPGPARSA